MLLQPGIQRIRMLFHRLFGHTGIQRAGVIADTTVSKCADTRHDPNTFCSAIFYQFFQLIKAVMMGAHSTPNYNTVVVVGRSEVDQTLIIPQKCFSAAVDTGRARCPGKVRIVPLGSIIPCPKDSVIRLDHRYALPLCNILGECWVHSNTYLQKKAMTILYFFVSIL